MEPVISEPLASTGKEALPRVAFDLEGYARKYVWWQSGGGRCLKRGALLRLRFMAERASQEEVRREAARLGTELIENSFRLVGNARTVTAPYIEQKSLVQRGSTSFSPASNRRNEREFIFRTPTYSTPGPAKGYRREPADLAMYAELKRILDDRTDTEWVSLCKQAFVKDRNTLLRELDASQRKGIEQAVRISCSELAHFYYDYGYLDESLQYLQMVEPEGMQKTELLGWVLDILRIYLEKSIPVRRSSEGRSHVFGFAARRPQMFFQSTEEATCISPSKDAFRVELFGQPVHIEHLAHLAEKTLEEKDVAEAAALRAALGMIALSGGHYRRAAKCFLAVTTAFDQSPFTDVVSTEDIATSAALCSLVSFSREEICEWVLQNSAFQPILARCPVSKNLLCNFYHRRFRELLQTLLALKNDLVIDPYMHRHVEPMIHLVHQRCYAAYVLPFRRVLLARMKSDLFGAGLHQTDECQNFERDIELLVRNGSIPGQLDPTAQLLHIVNQDEHARMVASVLNEVSDSWIFFESVALQHTYSSR